MSRTEVRKAPLRVLLVEDVTTDAELLLRELAREYEVEHLRVEDETAFKSALREPWEVVLCDYQMPRFSAPQALRVMSELASEVPLIVVTGSISEEIAVECMKLGASDYLLKDRLLRLPQAVAGVLAESRLRREKRAAEQELRRKEQELQQAQKMEAIGRLAGGIAHDFNNLLTVVLGYAELLGEQFPEGDPRRRETTEIQRASRRAAELTQQLLALSRRQVLEPRPLDLGEIVRRVQDFLRRAIGEDVALDISIGADLGAVLADPAQIEQVILNLAVNARDAMPGGGRLSIEVQRHDLAEARAGEPHSVPPGTYVALSVRDSGTGIAGEVLPHVFEPFFTTKPEGKGTGLGLSTVLGVVQQSGGWIQLETAEGRGTHIGLWFPRLSIRPVPPAPAVPIADDLRGDESILFVDDEPTIREFSEIALSRLGYRVLLARSDEEALQVERALHGPLDLAVLDVILQRRSGLEVALALRERRPDLPVLFVSGYGDERSNALQSAVPLAHVLKKPFTGRSLARKVREVLDGGPSPSR